MRALNNGDADLENQVDQWRKDPFNPHLIARMRVKAYMKNVVMRYLDNLLAWGDHLFHQDTLETLGEATQVYILAANILGQRPPKIAPRGDPPAQTFNDLAALHVDAFGNALVRLEEQIHAFGPAGTGFSSGMPSVLYFCTPANDKLLSYWDLVADRLFKIRNCMNIDGVVRQLPLFEPPLDPALLVRARALGVDLRDALASSVSLSPYRFAVLLQKANEICSDVRSLGAALLSAYEKRDGEALARLRAEHEIRLLDAMKEVRRKQIEEARESRTGLERTKEQITERHVFYRDIVPFNEGERAQSSHLHEAHKWEISAQASHLLATALHLIPELDLGISGMASTPVSKAIFGGSHLGSAAEAAAEVSRMVASQFTFEAQLSGMAGSNQRREEEWRLQERLAEKELAQIEKQILASDIRIHIAEKELENHDLQRENAREGDDFMRRKFTNQELYDWMVSQVSATYFQSHQLAFETARRAEQAYRFERGLTDSNFIRFGQWDSLRRGLLAGEALQLDLRRLEMAYLNENKREFELTRHISILSLDPLALVTLKETGRCEISIPELLFDLDYPGHFMRRIKSVSLTIPCVTGPYSSLNCTLTLMTNSTRISNHIPSGGDTPGGYIESVDGEADARFAKDFVGMKSIATSTGQNDSGMFEVNFRDERYLPFEGAGVISRWSLDLSGKWEGADFPQFDFGTISDIILHLNYTARDGGGTLKMKAIEAMQAALGADLAVRSGQNRMFSVRHEFPTEWHRFAQPTATSSSQSLGLDLSRRRFPFQFQGKNITIDSVGVFVKQKGGVIMESASITLMPPNKSLSPGETLAPIRMIQSSGMEGLLHSQMSELEVLRESQPPDNQALEVAVTSEDSALWMLSFEGPPVRNWISDIFLICSYSVKS